MNKEYWLKRWETGSTRFNQASPHRYLINHFKRLDLEPDDHILVPLCGKSIDMAWMLNQHVKILGIELSSIAIEQYIKETHISAKPVNEGEYKIYQNERLSIYNHDFFKIDLSCFNTCKAIYDRGCFTALPPDSLGLQYLEKIKHILKNDVKLLMTVFEHGNKNMSEPPFSTTHVELELKLGQYFSAEELAREHITDIQPHWKARGVHGDLYECCYLIQKSR